MKVVTTMTMNKHEKGRDKFKKNAENCKYKK